MITHNATHNEVIDQNRINQGLLRLIATVEPQDAVLETPDQGPCALGPGPLVLEW